MTRSIFVALVLTAPFLSGGPAESYGQNGDPEIGLTIEPQKVRANGIRALKGKYLTLYTDIPSNPKIDELTAVFDQAVTQWQKFFNVPADKVASFRAIGFVIKDKNRFVRADLFPAGLPPFKNGYTYGRRCFWMYDQPSDYMRRQLLIHEGTHAFIFSQLDDQIPAWINEGLAEHFASHLWSERKLTTRFLIRNREQAPFWGRTKVIRESIAAGKSFTVAELIKMPSQAFLDVNAYAWVWALVAFLDEHPAFRARFQKLTQQIKSQSKLNVEFEKAFADDWAELENQWQVYLSELDYGVSSRWTRTVSDLPKTVQPQNIPVIMAKGSWQNSGISIDRGKKYRIRSKGRYTIRVSGNDNSKAVAWPCEPEGITLEYYQGAPLGRFMACVKDKESGKFSDPFAAGADVTWTSMQNGVLYFRVNESPAGLADNSGEIMFSVQEAE